MILLPERTKNLAPPDPHWQGTGALVLPPDFRDYQLSNEPDTRMVMAAGVPNEYSLRQFKIGQALNQGNLGSCVAHSSSHMEMLYESMERSLWPPMDAVQMYRDNGGLGSNGVDSRAVLEYMQTRGVPVIGSQTRYKIKSYAFVDFSAGQFAIDTLKAAVTAGRPCVLALLLPTDFSNGMTAGLGAVSSAYHQICVCFFGGGRIGYLNSWGEGFGDQGFGSVPESYLLRAEERGYVYAFTTFDAPDEDLPTPTPTPTPTPIPTPTPTPTPAPDVLTEMVRLINQARTRFGSSPLQTDPALMQSAGGHAQDQATKGYYSHTGQDGSSPWDRMQRAGFTGNGTWGENIAAGEPDPSSPFSNASPSAIWNGQSRPVYDPPGGSFTDWMNSPGHRSNILSPAFTHVGVGHATGGQYGHYWVQDFACAAGPQPIPTPTPLPTPVPTPTPVPVPATVALRGIVTGTGTDQLSVGQTLSAQGASFVGSIALTEVSRAPGPTPTPIPDPGPEPQPDPSPGELEVEVKGSPGTGFITWAHTAGPQSVFVAATLTATADGQVIGTQRSANKIPARWLPGRGTRAFSVRAVADDGRTRTGQWP